MVQAGLQITGIGEHVSVEQVRNRGLLIFRESGPVNVWQLVRLPQAFKNPDVLRVGLGSIRPQHKRSAIRSLRLLILELAPQGRSESLAQQKIVGFRGQRLSIKLLLSRRVVENATKQVITPGLLTLRQKLRVLVDKLGGLALTLKELLVANVRVDVVG
jgi:hypothetical protein